MALKRLLLGISALSVVCISSAIAQQFEPTTANQDGIIIFDSIGRFFSAPLADDNIGQYLFSELEETSQRFGFIAPVARDFELVGNPDGSPKGAYAVDGFGGQFTLNVVTSPGVEVTSPIPKPLELGENNPNFEIPPYFGVDVIEDLEISPDWRHTTFGYKGYLMLDADGVVHPLGENNLPSYAYYPFGTDVSQGNIEDATLYQTLYPETIDVTGSSITPESLLQRSDPINFPVNWSLVAGQDTNSVTPVFTYFGPGIDIARDLEISAEYTQLTVPSSIAEDLAAGIDITENFVMPTGPSVPVVNRTVAMTNGYYILDGAGGVHSCRLPLDFDVNNDGEILVDDMIMPTGEMDSRFGEPINFAPLAPPWIDNREDLPYFGISPSGEASDFAVDIEITPSGKGFFLLDKFGGVFAVGDAHFNFPPEEVDETLVRTVSTTPYFGFPIARDLALVPNKANETLGLEENQLTVGMLVIDGFGTVHKAGLAETFNVSEEGNNGEPVETFTPFFIGVESTPVWLPQAPPLQKFVVGDQAFSADVAGNFVSPTASYSTVTGAFSTVTSSAEPVEP